MQRWWTMGACWLTACGIAHAEPEPIPLADGFDFPVGQGVAAGYYDAQPFGRNDHLGEDWNGVGGGATDLGDPVSSVATGRVRFVGDVPGGWGWVVRVEHQFLEAGRLRRVESLYAHLDTTDVKAGELVKRGQQIGSIGDAHGRYVPHLHLELRTTVGMSVGPGYAKQADGWVAPTPFIQEHRPQ